MLSPENSPFYVGYQKKAPAGLSQHFRKLLLGLSLLAVSVGLLLAANQQPAGPGHFELGQPKRYLGRIQERPSPVLWVDRGNDPAALQSSYDLVAAGKHGVGREFQGLDGRWVALSGALAHRPGRALLEVVEGSVQELEIDPGTSPPTLEELGRVELIGEVVDAKCYAGVMKPGRGKPHRDCAVRCIAGGIPAVFVVEAADGATLSLDLMDEEGRPVGTRLLDRIAEPLSVEGDVERRGSRLILRASPAAFRRLATPSPRR